MTDSNETTVTNDTQYFLKLTKKQLIAGATAIVTFLSGTGIPIGIKSFNSALQSRMFQKEMDYTKKINTLNDEIEDLKKSAKENDAKMRVIKADKEFLKLHSQYDIAQRRYYQSKTTKNLQRFVLIQNEYVKYIKCTRLQKSKEALDTDSDYQFFSDSVKFVDGLPYYIPRDVLLKSGR